MAGAEAEARVRNGPKAPQSELWAVATACVEVVADETGCRGGREAVSLLGRFEF